MLPYLWVDSPVGYVLNGFMKFPAPLCAALLPVLFSCAEQVSRIEHVREVPLKTTVVPAEDVGMHRTQATYLLHGAVSQQQRLQRLGQYYFVTWNDANPEQAATLVMMYRQGKTGSTVLTKSISYPAGRKGGTQNSVFEFIGDEAREKGGSPRMEARPEGQPRQNDFRTLFLSVGGRSLTLRQKHRRAIKSAGYAG